MFIVVMRGKMMYVYRWEIYGGFFSCDLFCKGYVCFFCIGYIIRIEVSGYIEIMNLKIKWF